jgi:putative ATP-binding cassette transporter
MCAKFCRGAIATATWMLLFVLVAVALISPVSAAWINNPPDKISTDQIDEYVTSEMAEKRLPGIALVIVSGQEIIYQKGFGYASLNTKLPVTPQTIFDLASCSKSFTALAALMLWRDGLIDLDKPLVYYLPEFRLTNEEYSSRITVRQLLNQTSGLPGDVSEPVSYHQGTDAMSKLITAMSGIHPEHAPGASFEYANFNYNLIGALVERVTGMRFEDFIQERIFTPLNMRNSTLRPEDAIQSDRADGHQLLLGKVVVRNVPIYRSAIPAGWVLSSAEDMGKWLIVNLNQGKINEEQVFPSELIEMMQTTAITFTEDGKDSGYGMGWFTGLTDNEDIVFWHGGDTPNFLSEMILLPQKRLGIVMLVNGQTCQGAHEIATGVLSLVLGVKFELPQAPWWASWKSVDNIAIYATILSSVLILGLIPYVLWQIQVIKRLRQKTLKESYDKKVKIRRFVLPVTPWMVLIMAASAAYVVMQSLFGFNVFVTIWRFGYFAPPGTLVAAASILLALFLWAIGLSITAIFRETVRIRKN